MKWLSLNNFYLIILWFSFIIVLCFCFSCFSAILERFNSPPSSPNDSRGFVDHTLDRVNMQLITFILCEIPVLVFWNKIFKILNWFLLFQSKVDEPIHVLNIAIRYDRKEDDDSYAQTFGQFCVEKVIFNFTYLVI